MKAIGVFPKERAVRLVDVPEPQIEGPNSIKLRMLEVGICGTDKEITTFEYGTPPAGEEFLVLGHESLGEVVETGPEVQGFARGDLAVVMVRRPCPHRECLPCRSARQDFCFTGDFTERGIKEAGGFMAEYVVDDARYVVRVPGELRDIAVLTEPLTIAEKAFTQALEIQERLPWLSPARGSEPPLTGRRGVVLGGGPVGILGALKLAAAGCEVIVYSREPDDSDRARLMRSLGLTYVSSEQTSPCALPSRVGAIDIVYEATGASKLAFDVLEGLGANAVFVFTGVPGRKAPVKVDTANIMRNMVLNNQVVFGTVNAPRESFEAAVRDLRLFSERHGDKVRQLITRRHRMSDFPALDLGKLGGIKNVLEVGAA